MRLPDPPARPLTPLPLPLPPDQQCHGQWMGGEEGCTCVWFWGWGLWVGRTGRIDSIAGLHWVAAGRPCGHGGAVNLDRLASILLLVIRA